MFTEAEIEMNFTSASRHFPTSSHDRHSAQVGANSLLTESWLSLTSKGTDAKEAISKMPRIRLSALLKFSNF